MYLKFIEEGSALTIREADAEHDETCEATFYRQENDSCFYASGEELYNLVRRLNVGEALAIAFFRGASMYTFTGIIRSARQEGDIYLSLIEQVSSIEVSSRREYDRNEMRRDVWVYGLTLNSLEKGQLRRASSRPEFFCDMFDISVGGICLVSNEFLDSPYEPYFILEFSLSRKDHFLLPAKLVRKGNCPQTALFRYDYGFEFIYTHNPQDKDRMIMSIFNAKVAAYHR